MLFETCSDHVGTIWDIPLGATKPPNFRYRRTLARCYCCWPMDMILTLGLTLGIHGRKMFEKTFENTIRQSGSLRLTVEAWNRKNWKNQNWKRHSFLEALSSRACFQATGGETIGTPPNTGTPMSHGPQGPYIYTHIGTKYSNNWALIPDISQICPR